MIRRPDRFLRERPDHALVESASSPIINIFYASSALQLGDIKSPLKRLILTPAPLLIREFPARVRSGSRIPYFFREYVARIRRTEVRPMFSWRAIWALLTPAR